MEQAEILAKEEEETVVIEDIGIVRDVDLANTVYTIPEVSIEYTPTLEADSTRADSEADSDVSIEPYMAQGEEHRAQEDVSTESVQEKTGEPVDAIYGLRTYWTISH